MNPWKIIDQNYCFECTQCGDCCRGDMRVELGLYDLYKLALFLKFTSSKELIANGYVHLQQHPQGVWMPYLRFKTYPARFCPFLINEADDQQYWRGLCSLHPHAKPLVCALSPVGRVLDFDASQDDYVFVKPSEDCPGLDSRKKNLLSDVKAAYGEELDYQERFFRILQGLKGAGHDRTYYLTHLYVFDVRQPFEAILKKREQQLPGESCC